MKKRFDLVGQKFGRLTVYNPKTNRYRARLKFKGRIMSFGTYPTFEEAVQARKDAEKQYFGGFLEELEEMEIEG